MTRDNERIYSTALGRNDLGDTRAHTDDHEPDLWFYNTQLLFLNPSVLLADMKNVNVEESLMVILFHCRLKNMKKLIIQKDKL